jgi:hypothetical protein
VEKGDVPVPSIKTFHWFGFINRLEYGCQDKSAHLAVTDETCPEKLTGYVKQSSEQHDRNNASVLGYFRGGQGSGFNDLMVTAQLQIRKVLDDSVGPSDIGIDRSRTRA